MSDTSQGEGWWQASDGRWYPPSQHPYTAYYQSAPGWYAPQPVQVVVESRGRGGFVAGVILAVVLLAGGWIAVAALGSSSDSYERADADLQSVDARWTPTGMWITATVKNHSEVRSDYAIDVAFVSSETKYGDMTIHIRNVESGQEAVAEQLYRDTANFPEDIRFTTITERTAS